MSTSTDETMTVRVVARPTPSAVGSAWNPSNAAINVQAKPNTRLLITPSPTSSRPTWFCICAHHRDTDQLCAEDAHDVEHRHQQWHGDEATQETRRHHGAQRIHRHHLHRGELVGGAHQADLRRK